MSNKTCLKTESFIKRTLPYGLRSVFLLLSLLLLSSCQSDHQEQYQQQLFSFGTLVDINILNNNAEQAQQLINTIAIKFDQMHADWHPWDSPQQNKKSVPLNLAQSNKRLTDLTPFIVLPSIVSLIQQSQLLSEKSNKLFNPALGQLVKLWQFDQLEKENFQFKLPTSNNIQNLLKKRPEMQDIIITGKQIQSQNPAVMLDFGAFAKGVAIEEMIHFLKKNQIKGALINAGGDLKVLGSKNGQAWRIGIKNPDNAHNPESRSIIAAIDLQSDEALFTSGNYERFFEFEGQHYHHIIDPRTGFPATGTRSVTVLTKDAALADAASTALFIAGPKLWPEIARQMGVESVMLMTSDDQIYLSSAMAERIELFVDQQPVIVKLSLNKTH